MRRLLAMPLACSAVLITTSCGTANPGSPTAPENPATSRSGAAPTSRLAPPLSQPELDTAPFEKDPCTLLRPEQVAQFGEHKPPESEEALTGPSCRWAPESSLKTGTPGIRLTVTINTKSGGLEGIYQRRDKFGHFQETVIARYPGVHALDWREAPANGDCDTLLGVGEGRLVDVSVSVRDKNHPDYATACKVSDRAAGMVIENLKGAK
ncbi:DUF3558 domain-containing protein [Longimycelium tulufanense]|uniref:DUF3558 domain-containing protein n=1 Tax=Longimycelium tulufanense TaxID=907463 RepID=UPI00166B69C3|nr:DUF3558 domain-containing protein [Longimycelium tulufanense]